jgi:ABC-type bacteriocin/lantibiotic exporter with double-glycine peptidase domain
MNTEYSEVLELVLALMKSYGIDTIYNNSGENGIINFFIPYIKVASGELENNNNCIKKIKGAIVYNNLSFSYDDFKMILTDVNLNIKSGERVLIIGKSGGGKSTLLKLLMNYYDVGYNKIFIDGIDLKNYNIKNLRDNICYISQNEKLLTDSIYNNIIFDRNINYNNFLKVTAFTKIDDFIIKDRLGYDFLLEENGFNISGGQRQRIILARGLLKGGNIILLDEALSEMDSNLERTILKNLFNYYKNKTFIVVSHRLDNRDLFTNTIKLVNGKIEAYYE